MRDLLYEILGISDKEKEKWMMDKVWGAKMIDIIIMIIGGVIVGVTIQKILSRYNISTEGKYVKYILIVILNLVVFGIYYVLHMERVDEYMGEIFDYLFEDPGEIPEVTHFSSKDQVVAAMREDHAEKLRKKRVEKPGWWRGITLLMGEKPILSI